MGRNSLETLMGGFVLLIAGLFLGFAYMNSQVTPTGYQLKAYFDRADGLTLGSSVRISGVQVGTVVGQDIDPKSYLAVVTFTVKNQIKIPKDTSAEILSDGFLGGKHLALVPGGSEDNLSKGETVRHTQSSINLESLIQRMMFSSKNTADK